MSSYCLINCAGDPFVYVYTYVAEFNTEVKFCAIRNIQENSEGYVNLSTPGFAVLLDEPAHTVSALLLLCQTSWP